MLREHGATRGEIEIQIVQLMEQYRAQRAEIADWMRKPL
jgi:hypothetical protein